MSNKEDLIAYLERFIGLPYIYGGSGPDGFDCSGLVVEGLRSIGLVLWKLDYSSMGLYTHFITPAHGTLLPQPERGALVFFQNKDKSKIDHVALCLNELTMLEAGGGDSTTKTTEDAIAKSAFVRKRPIAMRNNAYAFVMPNYY